MIEPMVNDVGEFYWLIEDVCRVLEISDVKVAVAALEPDEWAGTIGNSDSNAKMPAIVGEEGLYTLLLIGKAPIAREFRRWVTHDLLFRVLIGEPSLDNLDWTIKERLLTSGFLPNWDMYY